MIAALGLLVALVGTEPLQASEQHGPFRVRVQVPLRTLSLSESVSLTVELTGPAPLSVREPEPLLDTPGWSAYPATPPQLLPLSDGQERWTRRYRLEPELPGTPNSIQLRPIRVRDGVQEREIACPSLPVTVVTQVATPPQIDQLRPISDVEPATDPATDDDADGDAAAPHPAWVTWGRGGLLMVLVLIGVGAWGRWRWRHRPDPDPLAWALARLAECADPEAGLVILRQYLQRRYGVPAQAMTASELAEAAAIPGWLRDRLGPFLSQCEATRYAGQPLPDEVLAQVRQLLVETSVAAKLSQSADE